jgi:hypothetical protein
MAKVDVLAALQDDLDNPGAVKSGEFLEEQVLATVQRALIAGDREAVVQVMQDWLRLRQLPHTLLAASAAKRERLTELIQEIEALRIDVLAGRAFRTYYLKQVDDALGTLKGLQP